MLDVIAAVKENLTKKQKIEILGIGAGQGDREIPLLREIARTGRKISFDYLDVSGEYFKKFLKNLKRAGLADIFPQKHITDWRNFNSPKKFDIILAFHSFYGMKRNLRKNLQKIFNYLKPNGLAYILQSSEKGMSLVIYYGILGKKIVTGESVKQQLDEI